MKKLFTIAIGAALLLSASHAFTAESTNSIHNLVMQVGIDIKAGKTTEAALADDLKKFDELLAQYQGDTMKTNEAAQVLFMKAMLYLEVIDNQEKGTGVMQQLKQAYPGTKWAGQADKAIAMVEKIAAAKKAKGTLAVGAKFPDFSVTSVDGQPLSIAGSKGKVVLIDFWATWCGPCRAELPNVIATYQKHHTDGFNIIGVSLDEDKDKLTEYTKKMNMTWPQYFDGKGWSNELAGKYGVQSIPATYLIDRNGVIIGEDLRGEDLEAAVAAALKKN